MMYIASISTLLLLTIRGSLSQRTCPAIEVPIGGPLYYLTSDGRTAVGTGLLFWCGIDWYMVGSPVIECLPGGYWNDSAPHCVEGHLCISLSHFDNLDFHGVATYHYNLTSGLLTAGSTATIVCTSEDYQPRDGAYTATCAEDGLWKPHLPICYESCPTFPFFEHGHLSTNATYRGATVTLSCDPKYSLSVYNSYICENGEWQFLLETPKCRDVTCPTLFTYDWDIHLRFGFVPNPVVETTIIFHCERGWQLTRESVANVTCQADGTWNWNDTRPECIKKEYSSHSTGALVVGGVTGGVVVMICIIVGLVAGIGLVVWNRTRTSRREHEYGRLRISADNASTDDAVVAIDTKDDPDLPADVAV